MSRLVENFNFELHLWNHRTNQDVVSDQILLEFIASNSNVQIQGQPVSLPDVRFTPNFSGSSPFDPSTIFANSPPQLSSGQSDPNTYANMFYRGVYRGSSASSSTIVQTSNNGGLYFTSWTPNYPTFELVDRDTGDRYQRLPSTGWQRSNQDISFIGSYKILDHGRPGETSMLQVNTRYGRLIISEGMTGSTSDADVVAFGPTPDNIVGSYHITGQWRGIWGTIDVSRRDAQDGSYGYGLIHRFNITARNLPPVIPVTPETPSPEPNPVPPMPSVPPVIIPPPPAPTPPPPAEDMAVPPAPVVPRPVVVANNTPGLAPNIPVTRTYEGTPGMPIRTPRSVPNPYGGGSGSGSGNRNVARNITPRTGPQPVGG